MTQPPSFAPRNQRRRPDASGAQPVGSGEKPPAPRRRSVLPERSAMSPDDAERMPASFPPRRSAGIGESNPPAFAPQHSVRPAPAARIPADTNMLIAEPAKPSATAVRRRRFSPLQLVGGIVLLLIIVTLLWIFYLYSYGNSQLNKVDALSGATDTSGETYLIVGSDRRGNTVADGTEGQRADTIMLLHAPANGATALVSIPRDTYVAFPDGSGHGKLNRAFSYGGAALLVQTIEKLTGISVDHYVEIGMDGVSYLTDAVGGVELCLDYDVADQYSGLNWTAGCHNADGTTALAFSRMRYQDPLGDIGRGERQRQVVSKIVDKAVSPGQLLNPFQQKQLVGTTASVLTVDNSDSLMTVARAGFALRKALGPAGLRGAPPISNLGQSGPGGSTVRLDESLIDQFWSNMRTGKLTPESFASFN
ncbi:MAG: LCP family protein [Trueperella sp.]|nr:LCP family protein [Trueperella sp.]